MTTTEGPKRASGLKLGLIGCCGCLVAMIAFLGVVIGIPFMVTGPAVEVARRHLQTADADPSAAWAACASGLKATTTEAQFKAFVASHPELYKAADITFSSRSYKNGRIRVSGHTTTPAGASSPVELRLVEEGGAWRVLYVGSTAAEEPEDAPTTEAPTTAPATEAPATEAPASDRPR